MPLDASFVTAFFWVAVPAILLMAVWAAVTAFKLLFPDDALLEPSARRRRRTARGESVPVRLRDILDDERARQAVSAPTPGDAAPPSNPLFDDLWIRRN